MSQFYTSTDHFVLVPAIMLALFGCAVLLFDFFIFPEAKQRKWLLIFVVLGIVFAGTGLWRQQSYLASQGIEELTAFNGTLTVDGFS
ncbi:MAG: NADH-quinone oxidoreductase subunit N, partial [Bryobacteraceae bacterium]